MPEPGPQRDDQLKSAGDAQEDAHVTANLIVGRPVARVFERALGHDHSQELGRIGGLDGVWGDAELKGIEINRLQETTAPGVSHVRRFRVFVEVIFGPPMGIRNLLDRIDAAFDVRPVFLQSLRLGEHAADADDGDR